MNEKDREYRFGAYSDTLGSLLTRIEEKSGLPANWSTFQNWMRSMPDKYSQLVVDKFEKEFEVKMLYAKPCETKRKSWVVKMRPASQGPIEIPTHEIECLGIDQSFGGGPSM